MAQWLGLGAFTAVGSGSIPDWGTKICDAAKNYIIFPITRDNHFFFFFRLGREGKGGVRRRLLASVLGWMLYTPSKGIRTLEDKVKGKMSKF